MKPKFEIIFLGEAMEFLNELDEKTRDKIIYRIDKSKYLNDPELFKKLDGEIWEFRTKFKRLQHRLFAFWDRTDNSQTLVAATHGVIKKRDKVSKVDIDKAEAIRKIYFEQKGRKK